LRVSVAAALLACFLVGPAAAGEPSRTARGVFVGHDADAGSVTVRERGVERVYLLRDDDDARTVVTIEGSPSEAERLEAGSPIVVSWRPDPGDAAKRQARALAVPRIPKSFHEELR